MTGQQRDENKRKRNKWRELDERRDRFGWCFVCGIPTERGICKKCWKEIVEDDRRRSTR